MMHKIYCKLRQKTNICPVLLMKLLMQKNTLRCVTLIYIEENMFYNIQHFMYLGK